jgi:hypothetical protein
MASWLKITGTQVGKFVLGLTGVTLKNNSGNLDVRNNGDTAFASANVANVALNTATNRITLAAPSALAANYSITLPLDDGSPGQVLSTDGSGNTTWVSAASTASSWKVDTTSFAFGSGATITAFTLPANAVVNTVTVIVDTAFDGTNPSLSVGNAGATSKYFASTDGLLTVADRYDVPYQGVALGTTDAIEISYSAGGSTVGAGRMLVTYANPD